MAGISIILRKPPYGSIEAPEAVRHTLGAATQNLTARLILLDGGIQAARKNQDISGTAYLSVENGIRDCIDMGAEVYADESSLKQERVSAEDIVEGVAIRSAAEIAKVITDSDTVMIF
jgi:predicted peroxiredoxin